MKELIIILILQGFIYYKAPVGTSNRKYQHTINNPSLTLKPRKTNKRKKYS